MAQGIALAAPQPHGGKPTKCTPTIIAAVAKVVSEGGYPTVALEMMGLAGVNHAHWLKCAQRDIDSNLLDTCYILYSKAILKAQGEAEQEMVSRIREAANAGPQYWPAGMTYLERRHPDRWGKRERQEPPQHTTTVQIAFVPFGQVPAGSTVKVLDVPALVMEDPKDPTSKESGSLGSSALVHQVDDVSPAKPRRRESKRARQARIDRLVRTASGSVRTERKVPDTEDLGHSPPRICESEDTG